MEYRESNKHKILLLYLNPLDWASIAAPPYGLEILAAAIKDLDVETVIGNPFLNPDPLEECQRLIDTHNPKLIGLSIRNLDNMAHIWERNDKSKEEIQSRNFLEDIEPVIRHIRQIAGCPVLLGGNAYSICPRRLLDKFRLEIGVKGPGEKTFRELVKAAMQGENIVEYAMDRKDRLPGIVIREGNDTVENPQIRPFLFEAEEAIERIPEYSAKWTGTVPVRVSEGCNRQCIFCVEARRFKEVTWRKPGHIIQELRQLKVDETPAVWFTCSEFNLPDETPGIELCRRIRKAGLPPFRYSSYFLPHPFSEALYHELKEVGFIDHSICFSIVNPSDQVLRQNGIGYRRRHIDELVNTLVKAGAKGICMGLILGLPGETEETLKEAARWVREIDDIFGEQNRCFYNIGGRVYPNTELEQLVKQRGMKHDLYGAGDPEFLIPAVYSTPWAPRAIAEYFGTAVKDCKGMVANYNKGNPLTHEHPDVIINWQLGHVRRSISDFIGAEEAFREGLVLAAGTPARKQLTADLIPCLARNGKVKEIRQVMAQVNNRPGV